MRQGPVYAGPSRTYSEGFKDSPLGLDDRSQRLMYLYQPYPHGLARLKARVSCHVRIERGKCTPGAPQGGSPTAIQTRT